MLKWYKTTLFRIIAPILVISFVTIWISEKTVEEMIIKQVSQQAESEMSSFSEKLYGVSKNRYEVLFLSYADDESRFRSLEEPAKQETLRELKNISKNTFYPIFLFDGSKYTNLSDINASFDITKIKNWKDDGEIKSNKYVTKTFLPWGWKFIVIQNSQETAAIIETNKQVLGFTIAIVALLITITSFTVLYRAINVPFKKIFTHLEKIQKGSYSLLFISNSLPLELKNLIQHINQMTISLKNKQTQEEELIGKLENEKQYAKTLLDSQKSIVVVSNGHFLIDCNKPFFDFFDNYSSIEEFRSENRCICDFFVANTSTNELFIAPREEGWVHRAMESEQRAMMIKDGQKRYFGVNANKHTQDGTDVFVVTFDEITTLVEQKEELKNRLYTDALTGLPNRTKLLMDTKSAPSPTLFIINIDSFSTINDLYGYKTGDHLLMLLAKKLRRAISLITTGYHFSISSYGWQLYKLASDEYAILIPIAPDKEDQEKLAYSLCHLIEQSHFHCEGIDVEIKISVGISDSNKVDLDEDDKAKTILADADMALKKVKEDGLLYLFYEDEMDLKSRYTNNIECAKMIRYSIQEDRVVPYFQPLLNLRTQQIYKYEVLMRIIGQDGAIIPPVVFLDIAKSSKLYDQLTKSIIKKSFEYFHDKEFEFSVNLSFEDIANKRTRDYIIEMLEHYGIGKKVTFEILESEGIKNYDIVKYFINETRKYGCKCAIDDFGSGYSSFEHVLKLKTDYIKIDGSIIQNIDTDEDARAIAEAIVIFANKTGIKTVAEFVHNESVMSVVGNMGIDYAQGYHISEPKSATAKPA
jgi:diguanylate cyclase (GGDEF)-like protein